MNKLETNINQKAIELFRLLRIAGEEIGLSNRQVEMELDSLDAAIERFTVCLEKSE